MRVFGIDVIKGLVRSRSRRPVYALVRMEDGEVTAEGEVTQFRLLKEIAAEEPEILAVDSLQEIARDQHALFSFLEHLPPRTRLVQVTGGERPETLGKVAARYNISFDRFDPYAEARAAARIASLGGGAEVVAYENTCAVVVSRNRSLGKGGWSQNRYVRKVHGAVLTHAREIEDKLVQAEAQVREEGVPGLRRSLTGPVPRPCPEGGYPGLLTSRRGCPGADIRAEARPHPVQARRERCKSPHRGYRPGDHDRGGGRGPRREGGPPLERPGEVHGRRGGDPLPGRESPWSWPPMSRRCPSRWNGSGGYSLPSRTPLGQTGPERRRWPSPGVSRMQTSTSGMPSLQPWMPTGPYRNKFQSIQKRVPPGFDLNRVRAGIVRGQSIERILGELSPARAPAREEPPEPVAAGKQDERVMVLDGMVKSLRSHVRELQEEVRAKESEILRYGERLERERSRTYLRMKRDAEVAKRDAIIQELKQRVRRGEHQAKSLKRRLERQREVEEVRLDGSRLPLKVLPSLTRDGVQTLVQETGIAEGDLLYVTRSDGWGRSVVKDLAGLGVRALLVGINPPSRIDPLLLDTSREEEIPVFPAPPGAVQVRGPVGSVDPDVVENGLDAWEQAQQKEKTEKKKAMVEYLFKEDPD